MYLDKHVEISAQNYPTFFHGLILEMWLKLIDNYSWAHKWEKKKTLCMKEIESLYYLSYHLQKVDGITLIQEHWVFKMRCSSAFFVRIRGDINSLGANFYILPVVYQWNMNLQMSDLQTDFNVSKQSSERTNEHLANYKIDIAIT